MEIGSSPTAKTYRTLNAAYEHFNEQLFDGELPHCLITMQRRKGTRGYFSHERFGARDGSEKCDELALNPAQFEDRSEAEILSTLVHEMVHLWQHHYGKPGRGRYHNREWAERMKELGLVPSSTGQPGGKQTGDHLSHYIAAGGPFDLSCARFLTGTVELYNDLFAGPDAAKKPPSKVRYTCPNCGLNAWAKPEAKVGCLKCRLEMTVDGEAGKTIDAPVTASDLTELVCPDCGGDRIHELGDIRRCKQCDHIWQIVDRTIQENDDARADLR